MKTHLLVFAALFAAQHAFADVTEAHFGDAAAVALDGDDVEAARAGRSPQSAAAVGTTAHDQENVWICAAAAFLGVIRVIRVIRVGY